MDNENAERDLELWIEHLEQYEEHKKRLIDDDIALTQEVLDDLIRLYGV